MVVEYIRYNVSGKERRDELVGAYHHAAMALDQAPECLAYELSAISGFVKEIAEMRHYQLSDVAKRK